MIQRNKILFVITKGSPFGGAQKYVFDLATNTLDGFEAIVACGEGEDLPKALIEKGVEVVRIPDLERDISISKEWQVLKKLIEIIRDKKPYVIHLNSSKSGGLGALAGRLTRVPRIIFTAHGWAFNENRSQISKIALTFLHWLTVILSHETIAVSKKSKKDIAWLPFMKNKIRVIYNGMGKFRPKTKKESRLILSKEESNKKVIIYSISELNHNKGIDLALQGVARLPTKIREKIIYCIAGDGEDRGNLEKLTQDLGLSNAVKFLGFIPNAKELLSGADIFLLPSRTEAFPYVLLEAGSIPLPIIATNVGGVSEIINDMQNGILVHARDAREIAEAILYILENKDKQKFFKENIKEVVTSRFSLDKMISETYSVYKSLPPKT